MCDDHSKGRRRLPHFGYSREAVRVCIVCQSELDSSSFQSPTSSSQLPQKPIPVAEEVVVVQNNNEEEDETKKAPSAPPDNKN